MTEPTSDDRPRAGTVLAILVADRPGEDDAARRAHLVDALVQILGQLGYKLQPAAARRFPSRPRSRPPRARRPEHVVATGTNARE